MENRFMRLGLGGWCLGKIGLLGILVAVSSLAQERPLSLAAHPPETALIGRPFHLQLEAYGGVASEHLRIADGSGPLPPRPHPVPSPCLLFRVPPTPRLF